MVRPRSSSTGYSIDIEPSPEDAGTSSQPPPSRSAVHQPNNNNRPPSIEVTTEPSDPISSIPTTPPQRADVAGGSTSSLAPSPQIGRTRSPSLSRLFTSASRRGSLSNAPPPSSSSRRGSVSSSPRNSVRDQSIRIRRYPSVEQVPSLILPPIRDEPDAPGRRRSSSEPQRPTFLPDGTVLAVEPTGVTQSSGRRRSRSQQLENIQEVSSPTSPSAEIPQFLTTIPTATSVSAQPPNQGSRAFRSSTYAGGSGSRPSTQYESSLVDILDLVDPEIATLQTLTNVQNSLFVPDLGRFLNRTPTYNLTRRPTTVPEKPRDEEKAEARTEAQAQAEAEAKAEAEAIAEAQMAEAAAAEDHADPEKRGIGYRPEIYRKMSAMTIASIASTPSESYYAVLPHGVRLEGWSQSDVDELNDHVRHMLHSRRSRFKRSMKGFGQYVRKPLGFFITLYATLITLFGLAWVLFLIGWISVGSRKDYLINVIDNVLVALFAIMGDGLAPFRCVDTYHMCFIAHYHHLTWRLRREKALPHLQDENDLPPLSRRDSDDLEDGPKEQNEFSVLSEEQQKKLDHHQKKFSRSHTFYKPHETTTHHAFPLRLLVAIVCLLDAHSMLQISLGACTWGISYHHRPFALTTVILCCSITVNITAGILITVGDRMTRKKDVLELMKKQELTAEAVKKLEKRREKEAERNHDLNDPLLGIAEERESSSSSEMSREQSRNEAGQREVAVLDNARGKSKVAAGAEVDGVVVQHFGVGHDEPNDQENSRNKVEEEAEHSREGREHVDGRGEHDKGNGKEKLKKLRKEKIKQEAEEEGPKRNSSEGRRKLQKKSIDVQS